MLKITSVKSLIGKKRNHITTTHALELRKIGKAIEHEGTPQIKGMMSKVSYLLRVEEA